VRLAVPAGRLKRECGTGGAVTESGIELQG